MGSKYPIITAREVKLCCTDMSEPKESNRSGNGFLVSGILATLGASACCEGGLKFLCGSQPEIRDGSDQEEARRRGLGMQERAHSTPSYAQLHAESCRANSGIERQGAFRLPGLDVRG
jgi:hypothetical protein